MVETADLQYLVLRNIAKNEEYARNISPFVKAEYFDSRPHRIVFEVETELLEKYNACPTVEAILIAVEDKNITQDEYEDIQNIVTSFKNELDEPKYDWLVDETEKFCQHAALYNAMSTGLGVMSGEDKRFEKEMIPQLITDALSVSFDDSIGHAFFEDAEARFDFYNKVEEKLPFGIKMFDKVTKGGLRNKTLNAILASTGVGKSLLMCHFAATWMMQGKNVLYITMEMAEERIAERIDANLLDITLDDLRGFNKKTYLNLLVNMKKKTPGKLVIKEYPTASAHSGHFRHLLRELKIKKNFQPDVIIIDYLNICASSRMKQGGSVNSYTYIKSIAEELRGLAVEFDVPILTATQSNRDGANNSDIDLTHTSESFGLPATLDTFFAAINTEQLQALGQLLIKQLKNRFGDITMNSTFLVGIDRPKMRIYDVDSSQQPSAVKHPNTQLPSQTLPKTNSGQKHGFDGFKV